MSQNTKIQYCDHSVNAVSGCSGCELWNAAVKSCYAGRLTQQKGGKLPGFAENFNLPQLYPGRMAEMAKVGSRAGKLRRQKNRIKRALDGAKTIIFVSDMGDALSEGPYVERRGGPVIQGGIPFDYLRNEIIDVAASPQGDRHIWLWLTKRPGRMAKFASWLREQGVEWPKNLWAGTSITSAASLGRIADLEQVGAAVSFLSVEPLIEDVSLRGHLIAAPSVRWVIVGGESSQGKTPARPFDVAWARKLISECHDVGRHVFIKQLGSRPLENGEPITLRDGHGGDWDEWPEDLRVRQLPDEAYPPGPTRDLELAANRLFACGLSLEFHIPNLRERLDKKAARAMEQDLTRIAEDMNSDADPAWPARLHAWIAEYVGIPDADPDGEIYLMEAFLEGMAAAQADFEENDRPPTPPTS